jgi:single-strand DNA-binding protein
MVEVAFWGKRAAAVAQFITKGRAVTVVGEFSIRRFEHKGEKRASVQMRASDVILQGGGAQHAQQGTTQPAQAPQQQPQQGGNYPPAWDQNSPNQVTRGL